MRKISKLENLQLLWVTWFLKLENSFLNFLLFLLFREKTGQPERILIYKVGNIGDMICALPAFSVIRKNYPMAHITLLTSPGRRSSPGINSLLPVGSILDEVITYYQEDISDFKGKMEFWRLVKRIRPDMFIQIPDDWALFGTLFRNMLFAKTLGVKRALGFQIRTSRFFYKTQVDFLPIQKNETESLLDILEAGGISGDLPEFVMKLADGSGVRASSILQGVKNDFLIGVCPGGKGEDKRWPVQKFKETIQYLAKKNPSADFVFFGSSEDRELMNIIFAGLEKRKLEVVGESLSVVAIVLQKCRILLTNDTGPMHLAAALKVPVVALFGPRSLYGKWFPYGKNHKILFKRFSNCNYKSLACRKKTLEEITIKEVQKACEDLLKEVSV